MAAPRGWLFYDQALVELERHPTMEAHHPARKAAWAKTLVYNTLVRGLVRARRDDLVLGKNDIKSLCAKAQERRLVFPDNLLLRRKDLHKAAAPSQRRIVEIVDDEGQLTEREEYLGRLPPIKDESEPVNKGGRPPGSGGYRSQDMVLIYEAGDLMNRGEETSWTKALERVVPKAQGENTEVDSKFDRLNRLRREVFGKK